MQKFQNEIVNFYKPRGISSASFLNKVKKLYSIKKAGFAGTLDPLAEGVLIVGTGLKTKELQMLTDCDKSYEFTVKFGIKTSTGDLGGEVIAEDNNFPSFEDIIHVLPEFTGTISQTPHVFSALKHQGKRLCDLKREGFKDIDEVVKSKIRDIHIFRLELIKKNLDNEFVFSADCSKGTYIRSLAEDIATRLNTVCVTTKLIRTKVGDFDISNSLKLDLEY